MTGPERRRQHHVASSSSRHEQAVRVRTHSSGRGRGTIAEKLAAAQQRRAQQTQERRQRPEQPHNIALGDMEPGDRLQ